MTSTRLLPIISLIAVINPIDIPIEKEINENI